MTRCGYYGCPSAPSDGHTLCDEHLAAKREYARAWRAKAKEIGNCSKCGAAPARDGLLTCKPCGKTTKRDNAKHRRRYRELGMCATCGGRPPAPGKATCERCIRLRHARHIMTGALKEAVESGAPAVLPVDLFEPDGDLVTKARKWALRRGYSCAIQHVADGMVEIGVLRPECTCECGQPKEPDAECCDRCNFIDGGKLLPVVSALADLGEATVYDLAGYLGKTDRTAWRQLAQLVDMGRVTKRTADREGGHTVFRLASKEEAA